ncbi:5-hydroxytryptamine receptor 1A-beta-like [Paramacrobiotus metropolitanus]|uniref:5-hydroxytryptamine receptor 1A-beta-like n=1 Tax=Paramacrobiotus metropolitanus TaxID=2943436 RepID=UPI00244652B9|nr:5-hydroxytryptamine receptor 1A-beta-like [Paramacrobiotus metropolitanus]
MDDRSCNNATTSGAHWSNATDNSSLDYACLHYSYWGDPLAAIEIAAMVLVIVCNTAGLASLYRTTAISGSFKPYIANLLLANLAMAILENPLDILFELSCDRWTLSWAACDFFLYCNYVFAGWEMHAHLLITVNRLWAMIFPYNYRHRHTMTTSFVLTTGAFIYVHAWILPGLVRDSLFFRIMGRECEVNGDAQRPWQLMVQTFLFLAPIAFVAGSYVCLVVRQRMRLKTRPDAPEIELQSRPTDNGTSGEAPAALKKTRRQNSRAFFILTLLTCSLVVTWTPYQVCQLLQIGGVTVNDDVVGALDVLWIIQSILDPLLSTSIVSDVRTVFVQRH